jgi:hypothetical protein
MEIWNIWSRYWVCVLGENAVRIERVFTSWCGLFVQIFSLDVFLRHHKYLHKRSTSWRKILVYYLGALASNRVSPFVVERQPRCVQTRWHDFHCPTPTWTLKSGIMNAAFLYTPRYAIPRWPLSLWHLSRFEKRRWAKNNISRGVGNEKQW